MAGEQTFEGNGIRVRVKHEHARLYRRLMRRFAGESWACSGCGLDGVGGPWCCRHVFALVVRQFREEGRARAPQRWAPRRSNG